MDSLWQDFRYAFRGVRNQPGFAALAVLTLALGIGATTTMYSVIYNVLFDPFPYLDANKVVAFQIRPAERANQPGGRNFFQLAEWLDYKEQNHVFEECIATSPEDVLMTTAEGTLQFTGALVSDNMFKFLGVPPLYGRGLSATDAQPGAAPVLVMAYKMWTKYYNFDPAVVGRTFTLNGVVATCVGVMPKRFTKMDADLYRPVIMDRSNATLQDLPAPDNQPFEIVGVVADTKNRGPSEATEPETYIPYAVTGVFDRCVLLRTAGDPLALVNTVRREIWAQDRAVAVTDIDSLQGYLRSYAYATPRFSLLVLGVFAVVGLVLVGLGIYSVVAYTVSRQTHEIGIRMALGATRADVMRLVLRMGFGLVLLGAFAGLLASIGLTRVLTLTNGLWQVPPNDPLTLTMVFAVIVAAGFLACYFPARRATKVDPMVALRSE